MTVYYNFKIEDQGGTGAGPWYCGLGGTDDAAPEALAKTYEGWQLLPAGPRPTADALKALFTARQQDSKGADIVGTSAKDKVDAYFVQPKAVPVDVTTMTRVDKPDLVEPITDPKTGKVTGQKVTPQFVMVPEEVVFDGK